MASLGRLSIVTAVACAFGVACYQVLDVQPLAFEAPEPPPPDCDPEADRATDARHCGTCGHDCLGGACVAGVCQAASVLEIPSGEIVSLTVDDDHVWYSVRDGQVLRVALRGGEVAEVVPRGRPAARLALGGPHLYWVEDGASGSLFRAPREGGEPAILATGIERATGLVWADDRVYVVYTDQRQIGAVPVSGGPLLLERDGVRVDGLAASPDAGALYWTDERDGGRAIVVAETPHLVDASVLRSGSPGPVDVTLGGDGRVHWIELADVRWRVLRASTLDGDAEALASVDSIDVAQISVSPNGLVYWVQGRRSIRRLVTR